jgi:purine-binding chemotaxis protein CheW
MDMQALRKRAREAARAVAPDRPHDKAQDDVHDQPRDEVNRPGSTNSVLRDDARVSTGLPRVIDDDQSALDAFLFANDRAFSATLVPSVTDVHRHLVFSLAGERYAADIMDVREIMKFITPTALPHAPRCCLGVVSRRGRVLPVIDLALLLGVTADVTATKRTNRVLFVGQGDRVCGLRVDGVQGVVGFTGALEPVPLPVAGRNASALRGICREDLFTVVLAMPVVLDLVGAEFA